MKKIFYLSLILLTTCIGFTACGDDDEDNGTRLSSTPPAEAAIGTYSGTWTSSVELEDEDGKPYIETKTGSGTVVISKESDYLVNLSFNSSELELSEQTLANVQWASYGLAIYNMSNKNGLGKSFSGKVVDGNFTVSFIKEVRPSAFELLEYTYSFDGNK